MPKHLVNQGNFTLLIYVYVINRGKTFKPEIFELNTLIKQTNVVWKKGSFVK